MLVFPPALVVHQSTQITEPKEILQAVGLAKDMGAATISGDFEKVINLTNPKIVELMGGKANAISATSQAIQGLKGDGFVLTSYAVHDPSQVLRDGKRVFVIIPTQTSMQTPKGLAHMNGYLLGLSEDDGATWSFADGAGMKNDELRKTVFPDLPSKLVLPVINPPTIDK